MTDPGWSVVRVTGAASDLHARELPHPLVRTVWVFEVDRPALVLGSTQRASAVDRVAAEVAGVEVVRRRSGGGAVLLGPGEALWLDVVIPRHDPLWDDDVGRAAHWLGVTWAGALGDLGLDARVHRGPLVPGRWSGWACFGGIGPGEVTVSGRKVVGISQRRTRAGARFQCVVLTRWDLDALVSLLALAPVERGDAAAGLRLAATAVDEPPAAIEQAFLRHLPA